MTDDSVVSVAGDSPKSNDKGIHFDLIKKSFQAASLALHPRGVKCLKTQILIFQTGMKNVPLRNRSN